MSYNTLLLLLLATFISPFSSASSIPHTNTLNQFNVSAMGMLEHGNLSQLLPKVANLSGTYKCIPSSKYLPWTRRPGFQDCGRAIRRLPSTGDINIFRRVNRANPLYQLPRDTTVGSCKVTVNLSEHGVTAWSSWVEIGLAATQLTIGCMKKEFTGGNTTCGEQDKIDVMLQWVKNRDPDDVFSADGPDLLTSEA